MAINICILTGRLTKNPEVRYTSGTQMAVATFTIAIDRITKDEKKTDFPRVIVFGKQAENCERFLKKGRLVGIQGRLQTGSYEKDGAKVFTTDVVAERVEFLEWGEKADISEEKPPADAKPKDEPNPAISFDYMALDADIPF